MASPSEVPQLNLRQIAEQTAELMAKKAGKPVPGRGADAAPQGRPAENRPPGADAAEAARPADPPPGPDILRDPPAPPVVEAADAPPAAAARVELVNGAGSPPPADRPGDRGRRPDPAPEPAEEEPPSPSRPVAGGATPPDDPEPPVNQGPDADDSGEQERQRQEQIADSVRRLRARMEEIRTGQPTDSDSLLGNANRLTQLGALEDPEVEEVSREFQALMQDPNSVNARRQLADFIVTRELRGLVGDGVEDHIRARAEFLANADRALSLRAVFPQLEREFADMEQISSGNMNSVYGFYMDDENIDTIEREVMGGFESQVEPGNGGGREAKIAGSVAAMRSRLEDMRGGSRSLADIPTLAAELAIEGASDDPEVAELRQQFREIMEGPGMRGERRALALDLVSNDLRGLAGMSEESIRLRAGFVDNINRTLDLEGIYPELSGFFADMRALSSGNMDGINNRRQRGFIDQIERRHTREQLQLRLGGDASAEIPGVELLQTPLAVGDPGKNEQDEAYRRLVSGLVDIGATPAQIDTVVGAIDPRLGNMIRSSVLGRLNPGGAAAAVVPGASPSEAAPGPAGPAAAAAERAPVQPLPEPNESLNEQEQDTINRVLMVLGNPQEPLDPQRVLEALRANLKRVRPNETDEAIEAVYPNVNSCVAVLMKIPVNGRFLYLVGPVRDQVIAALPEAPENKREQAQAAYDAYQAYINSKAAAEADAAARAAAPPPAPVAPPAEPGAPGPAAAAPAEAAPQAGARPADAAPAADHPPAAPGEDGEEEFPREEYLAEIGEVLEELRTAPLADRRALREEVVDNLWRAEARIEDPAIGELFRSTDAQHQEITNAFLKEIRDSSTPDAEFIAYWRDTDAYKNWQDWENWKRQRGVGGFLKDKLWNPIKSRLGMGSETVDVNPPDETSDVDPEVTAAELEAINNAYGASIYNLNTVAGEGNERVIAAGARALAQMVEARRTPVDQYDLLMEQIEGDNAKAAFREALASEVAAHATDGTDWTREASAWLDIEARIAAGGNPPEAAPGAPPPPEAPPVVPLPGAEPEAEPADAETFDRAKRTAALERVRSLSEGISSDRQLSPENASLLFQNIQTLLTEGGLDRDDAQGLRTDLTESMFNIPAMRDELQYTYPEEMQEAHAARDQARVESLLQISEFLSLDNIDYVRETLNPAMREEYNISEPDVLI